MIVFRNLLGAAPRLFIRQRQGRALVLTHTHTHTRTQTHTHSLRFVRYVRVRVFVHSAFKYVYAFLNVCALENVCVWQYPDHVSCICILPI